MAREPRYDLLNRLTPREREVRELLRLGLTDAQISERLGVSKSAVSHHVSSMISKLGVHNRYEAAHWPQPPPWWARAIVPVASLWRKAAGGSGASASTAALIASGASFLVVLGGLALIGALLLRAAGNAGADREPAVREDFSLAGAERTPDGMDLASSTVPAATATPGDPGRRLAPTDRPRGISAQRVAPAALHRTPSPTRSPGQAQATTESGGSPADAASTPAPTSARPAFGIMAMDCDARQAGIQDTCAYASGASFRVQVHVARAPGRGYHSFKAVLGWQEETLEYLPTADEADESLWAGCEWPQRWVVQELLYGCFPLGRAGKASQTEGAILEFRFTCREEGAASLDLVVADALNPHDGTHFMHDILSPIETYALDAQVICATT